MCGFSRFQFFVVHLRNQHSSTINLNINDRDTTNKEAPNDFAQITFNELAHSSNVEQRSNALTCLESPLMR